MTRARFFSRLNTHRARVLTACTLTLALLGDDVRPLAQLRPEGPSQLTQARVPPVAEGSQARSPVGRIRPNRRVPTVTPPSVAPVFSAAPTDAEIGRARIFAEPLVPIGRPARVDENQALAQALRVYLAEPRREQLNALNRFLLAHPDSPWRASLMASFGTIHRNTGYFSRAAAVWDQAWVLAKDATDPRARAIADYAVSQWLDLMINFGQVEQVKLRLAEIEGRQVGGSAAQRIALAREGVWFLTHQHHRAIFSGPEAVRSLLGALQGAGARRNPVVSAHHPPDAGMSLAGVRRLAGDVGIPLRMLKRPAGAPVAVPSIVHLRSGHFSAIVEESRGYYLLKDPILGGSLWISREALDDEASGYVLVLDQGREVLGANAFPKAVNPADTARVLHDGVSDAVSADLAGRTAGWDTVGEAEAATIFGRCGPKPPHSEGPDDENPEGGDGPGDPGGGNDEDGDGDEDGDDGDNKNDDEDGEEDEEGEDDSEDPDDDWCFGLVGYHFDRLRAALLLSDVPVGYAPPRGPSVYFRLKYNQRATEQPQTFTSGNLGPRWRHNWIGYVADNLGTAPPFLPWLALVVPGSGTETYKSMNPTTGVFERHYRSRAILVRTSTDPIRYERRLPTGVVQVFAQPDGGPNAPGRKVFLSEIIDSRGQSLHFTYDSSVRLVAVTDALGQVTTLSYDLPGDPLKITRVTDPFGRYASFTYDASGRLTSITDVIGIVGSFAYDHEDFVLAMMTPYGTTTFRREPAPTGIRFIEAIDPRQATERLEYHYEHSAIPAAVPVQQVPTGFSAFNTYMNRDVSLYWSKLAMAQGGGVAAAKIVNWLAAPDLYYGGPIAIPHSLKRPLEHRVWYRYPDQHPASGVSVGVGRKPSTVARVLDDGTSQIWQRTFNVEGRMTSRTDPVGRQRTYVYAANNIDLLEVRQTTGGANELLAQNGSYTAKHRPQTATDAAGQTTTYTYNAHGQVLTVTNPKSETTTYAYDAGGLGYLQSVTEPVSGAVTTYTYDDYARVRTVTRRDGYAVTTDYDALDRPTKVTYPDGTFEEITYARLDASAVRDRRGRWSRLSYDSLGRLVAVRDALGRTTTLDWCGCGKLEKLVDPEGQTTKWERDVQGRITREVRSDGVTATALTYETSTSRLKTSTDPKGQVTTFSYNTDGTLNAMAFTNSAVATPSITYAYDPAYQRPLTTTDGTGTTTYSYKATGTLGAGQVASIDGPLSGDLMEYTYDQLGRTTSRAIDGVAASWSYDTLGRVATEANVLGSFTFGYGGVTPRPASVIYPNGQTTEYTYFDNFGDYLIQTIHHKKPGGTTLSKFDYTFDDTGNVLTWQQQADGGSPVMWNYAYDAADQLLSAVLWSTGGSPAILARYVYTYDRVGNRKAEQIDDVIAQFTHTALNRATQQAPGGALRFAGSVSEPATVTIEGREAQVDATNAFSGSANVTSGTNLVHVQARDASGNVANATYSVAASGSTKMSTFDANGNLTADGARTFEWDARNQLVAVTAGTLRTEFTYDGLQRRVRVVEKDNGVTQSDTRLVWCDMSICEQRAADGTTVLLREFSLGEQVGGTAHFFSRDHLASVREVTDGTAALLARYAYDAYGRRTLVAGTDVTTQGFTGHAYLRSAGLWLAPYRGYDPQTGRWISEDPLGVRGGINLYGYVSNMPLSYVDLEGLGPSGILIGGVIGGVGGAVMGGTAGAAAGAATGTLALPGGGTVAGGVGGAVAGSSAGAAAGTIVGALIGDAVDDIASTIRDAMMAQRGNRNVRDSGLTDVSNEEVNRRARDRSDPDWKRYKKEDKARKQRNKQKRGNRRAWCL